MSRIARSKRANQATPTANPPSDTLRYLGLGICLLLGAGAAWGFVEFFVWNKVPSDLVGKWVVEGGEQDGATFDFYRNGAMIGRINVNGREGIIDARVEIKDSKLMTTTQNPRTGKAETRTQTIQTFNRNSLVLVDDRGTVLRMARAD